jgi:IS5 family transposase
MQPMAQRDLTRHRPRRQALRDDQTEYQLKGRLSFMRFVGLALHDPVPDAKTIWLYREQLGAGRRGRAAVRPL